MTKMSVSSALAFCNMEYFKEMLKFKGSLALAGLEGLPQIRFI